MQPLRPLASSRCLASAATRSAVFSTPLRSFSTTQKQCRQTPTHLTVPKEKVPDYPYGDFRWYKQANSGLYGNSKIRYGNTVSQPRLIKVTTQWRPNRHTKRLWSPALNMFIRTRLTTSVLRTIDKLGGIDNYLLGTKTRRIKDLGPAGWRLRWKVMQSPAIQARWAAQREALGLPPKAAAGSTGPGMVANPTEEQEPEGMAELERMLEQDEEIILGHDEALLPGEKLAAAELEAEAQALDAAETPVESARETAREVLENVETPESTTTVNQAKR